MNSLNEAQVEAFEIYGAQVEVEVIPMAEAEAFEVHGGSVKVNPHPVSQIKEEQVEGGHACADWKLKRKVIEEGRCSPPTPNKPGHYVRRRKNSTNRDNFDSRSQDGRNEGVETFRKDCHSRDSDGCQESHDRFHPVRDPVRELKERLFDQFRRYYDQLLDEHLPESPKDSVHGFQEFKRHSDQKRESPVSGLHDLRSDSRSSPSIARDASRGCEEFKLYSDQGNMHETPSRNAGRGSKEFKCYSDQDRPSRCRDEGRRVQEVKHCSGHNDHDMQESPRDGGRGFRDQEMNHEPPPSRDEHRRRPSVSLPVVRGREQRSSRRDKEEDKRNTYSKIEERLGIPLKLNGVGEPQDKSEIIVSKLLAKVVNEYLSPTVTWSSVSAEIKYKIGQKLQEMFKDGSKLSQKWIAQRAKKLYDSARERAKNQLFRDKFKSDEEDFSDEIDELIAGYSPRGNSTP